MTRRIIWSSALLTAAVSASATAADQMTFKNSLLPGNVSIHRISRTILREAHRKDYVEKLKYRQVARWVQCTLNESAPGGRRIIQMTADRPAKIVSLFHDSKKISPPPGPATYNLSGGSTRLHSLVKTSRDAPVLVPNCRPIERAVLQAMLDVAHWPKKKVNAGHKWQRDIFDGDIVGKQSYKFMELIRANDQTAAHVRMTFQGEFQGFLARDFTFVEGRAIFVWARLDRTLLKLEGRAIYKRRRPNGDETYEMKIDVSLRDYRNFPDEKLDQTVQQLIDFDDADSRNRKGRKDEARRLCQAFRAKWPDSLWLPAIGELEDRAAPPRKSRSKSLKTSQLKKRLGAALINWEAARTNLHYDILDHTRVALSRLVADNREKVRKLAKSKKVKTRAPAVFALAFSGHPDDFYLVQKSVRDDAPQVRGIALIGLAARRHPETSVDLLMLALQDKNAAVRARACRASAACVSREHFSIAKIVEMLAVLMIDDDNVSVRQEAIRALAAVGAPADVPHLEKALTHELDKINREEIEKAIARLTEP